MRPSEDHHALLHETGDAEVAEYRPVSKLAVAAILLGLVSPVAVIFPVMLIAPLVGAIAGGLALWQIGREGSPLVGRKAALVGLVLSIGFGAAAPGHWLTYRALMRSEARQFAAAWFDLIRQQQPQKAFQLTRHPNFRRPLDDSLWDHYKGSDQLRRELENWVSEGQYGEGPRLIRTLLALGDGADVRYFSTEGHGTSDGVDAIYQIYAVTCDEGSGPKTFFVGLELKRFLLPNTGRAAWQVASANGGVRPSAFGSESEESD